MSGAHTGPLPVLPASAPDLDAGLADVLARAETLLGQMEADPSMACGQLAIMEMADLNDRLATLRIAYQDATAEAFLRHELVELGRQLERDDARARRRGGAHARQSPIVTVLKGGLAAIVAAAAVAYSVLRHTRAGHLAAKAVAVHGPVKAGFAAATLASGGLALAVTSAVVIHSATAPGGGFYGGAAGPAPAASASAAPISSPSLAGNVRHAKTAAKEKKPGLSVAGATQPPQYWYTSPSSSQPQPPSSPAPSSPSGPAVLTVSTTAIDLTGGNPVTITVSASGAGWAHWKVDLPQDPQTGTAQKDLDFSATSGVLQAGQSVTVTVRLDPVQDGNLSETFVIAGVPVTATLPAPAAAPSPTDTPSPGPSPVPS